MKNDNIERDIQETLNSLGGLKRAEANPFLYTRVAHILNRREYEGYRKPFIRLAFALIMFTCLNVFTYIRVNNVANGQDRTKTGIEAFAAEYGLQQTGLDI